MKTNFYARYGLLMLMAAVFLQPLVMLGSRSALLNQHNDLRQWLPPSLPETSDYQSFRRNFPSESCIVASWEGCTLDDPRLESLLHKLVPPVFGLEVQTQSGRLLTTRVAPGSAANLAKLLPGDAIVRVGRQPVATYADLRVAFDYYAPGQEVSLGIERDGVARDISLIPDAMPPAASTLFEGGVTGARVVEELKASGLSAEQALTRLSATLVGPDPRDRHLDGSLVDPQSVAPRQTCIVLTPSPTVIKDPRAAVAAIETAAAASAIPRGALHLGGPLVDNVSLDREGTDRLNLLSAICGIIGLGLSYYCLRNRRLALLLLIGAAYSAGISLAAVSYAGHTLDALLLTMPAVAYTAALSVAIHLINYYRRIVVEEGATGAAGKAVLRALPPSLLSATAIATVMFSLCLNELLPVVKFGLFTGFGVVAMLALLFTYLPSAMTLWPPEQLDEPPALEDDLRRVAWLRALAEGIIRRRGAATIAGIGLLLMCGYALSQAQMSASLRGLFAPESASARSFGWLEQHLGPQTAVEVVLRMDATPPSTTDEHSRRMSVARRLELIQRIQERIRAVPEAVTSLSAANLLPDAKALEIETPLKSLGLAGDFVTVCDGEQLWRIQVRIASAENRDYDSLIRQIKLAIEPVLAAERQRGTAGIRGIACTGMAPLADLAQRALLASLIENLAWGAVLLAAVMAIVYSSVAAGIATVVSMIWPLIVVFGTLTVLDIPIDIGAVMTATVAVAVSIDNTLHFTAWFRRGTSSGMHHRDAVVYAYLNVAIPIAQRTAIVGLGMAVFMLSNFMPTQRFGALINLLLGCGLVADLILVPALLSGPLSALFTRRHSMATMAQMDQIGSLPEQTPATHGIPSPHFGRKTKTVPNIQRSSLAPQADAR